MARSAKKLCPPVFFSRFILYSAKIGVRWSLKTDNPNSGGKHGGKAAPAPAYGKAAPAPAYGKPAPVPAAAGEAEEKEAEEATEEKKAE
jgi:hypothetical protein